MKRARRKKNTPTAKPAAQIPVAFHPAINEAHIIGGNKDAHAILSALFKACGWKVYTKSPPRKGPPVVTHSHYEKARKKK